MEYEEISCEDFYNQVQGELLRLDASTELIKKANIGLNNEVTDEIESMWMDEKQPTEIALELIEKYDNGE